MIEGRPRESLVLYDNPIEVCFDPKYVDLIFRDIRCKYSILSISIPNSEFSLDYWWHGPQ